MTHPDKNILPASRGSNRRRVVWLSCAIFAVALLIRLIYLVDLCDSPSFGVPMVDAQDYHQRARSLAQTGRVSDEFFYQAWFYPSYLAAVYKLTGGSILTAQVIQALLGATTCMLTFWLARELFDWRAGIIASMIVSLYAPLLYFEAELLATGWATFFSVALVLLFLKARDLRGGILCLLLGLVAGLSILARTSFVPFVLAGGLWLLIALLRLRIGRKRLACAGAGCLVGFCFVTLPGALLMHQHVGIFSVAPFSGGLNLYIGNNPDTRQTINARPGWQWQRLVNLPNQEGRHGPRAQQEYFLQKVKQYATDQPGLLLRGILNKTARYACSRELPRNTDMYVLRHWSGLLKLLVWKVEDFGFPFGVLLPLAVLGMVLHAGRCPWIPYLFLLLKPLSIILVFVSARYRIPAVPIFAAMAAGGCVYLPTAVRDKRFLRVTLAVACALAVIPLSTCPGPFHEEVAVNYEAELYGAVGVFHRECGDPEQAVEYFTKAIDVHADYSDILNELGRHWFLQAEEAATRGDENEFHANLARAADFYERARKAAPENPVSYLHLAMLAQKQSQLSEAIETLVEGLRFNSKDPQLHCAVGSVFLTRANQSSTNELQRGQDLVLALNHLSEAVELLPSFGKAHGRFARALAMNGKVDQAVTHYDHALRLKFQPASMLREFAWIMATDAEAGNRNSKRAVRLARSACRGSEPIANIFLDTLAAAHAEAGQFTLAIKFVQYAIDQARAQDDQKMVAQLQIREQLYLSRLPYRQPPRTKP